MLEKFGKVLYDEPISKYTTYKLSGKISRVIYPSDVNNLVGLLKYLKHNNIKHRVIGNGSNLVFKGNYAGVIIKLDNFCYLKIEGNIVHVGAGYNLLSLVLKTANLGLSGLEFASGIPATIGGAIYMNAGAYGEDMSGIVKEVTIIDENLNIKKLDLNDLNFKYRSSILKKKNYICLDAILKLEYSDKNKISQTMKERKINRLKTQPLNYPSAGSVFRNPLNNYAGKLIEEAGLKGIKIGGAMVSLKHANFIINIGGASGSDVYELIMFVKEKVRDKYDIELIIEQEFIE